MSADGAPLPSASAPAEAATTDVAPATPSAPETAPTPPPFPRPTFKISTFLYVFFGILGFWMLIDTSARNGLACAFGTYSVGGSATPVCAGIAGPGQNGAGPLYALIGFHSDYLLLTMALAGAIEMLITAAAYNFTTDWVKAAKVQKWSQAFRKVQMEALRSGKKDRIAALRPHQERLTRLSSEVSIAQFKGMAITYFLLILIYTWVGLVIGAANSVQQTLVLGGANLDLVSHVGPVPWWFLLFALYTVPTSMVFRRVLKHAWLRRYAEEHALPPHGPLASGTAGSSA